MHQQIRVMLAAPSSTTGGPGAMTANPVGVDPLEVQQGALYRLLDDLAKAKYNLRSASGHNIETGGVFVFAIDDEGDENRSSACAKFLHDKGYNVLGVYEPFMCEVDDRVGALRDCLEQLSREDRLVDEILVGTPRKNKIPIQVTTIRSVAARG
jgi:hypothetical protein